MGRVFSAGPQGGWVPVGGLWWRWELRLRDEVSPPLCGGGGLHILAKMQKTNPVEGGSGPVLKWGPGARAGSRTETMPGGRQGEASPILAPRVFSFFGGPVAHGVPGPGIRCQPQLPPLPQLWQPCQILHPLAGPCPGLTLRPGTAEMPPTPAAQRELLPSVLGLRVRVRG